MTLLDRIQVILEGDTVALTRSLQGAEAAMAKAGRNMQRVGRTLSVRVTAPILAVGAAATKMGADFEAEMQKIVGLVGVSQDQVDAWSSELLDLGPQLGQTPKALAEGLFFVTSAGFRGAAAMEVLTATARAASSGLGDVATIADAVTSAVNAYGIENLSAADATDVLTAAVREGKLEAESLAPVLGNLLPVASGMGVQFDQVAGILAVFSRTGQDAAAGATSLLNLMLTLQKPTAQTSRLLEGAGISMGELRDIASQQGGLIEVMRILERTFAGNDEALARIFPNIRAFRGVMNALAQDADTVDSIMSGVANSTGAADHAFASAEDTVKFLINSALSKLAGSLIRIGTVIGPSVANVLSNIADVVERVAIAFEGLDPPLQRVVLSLVSLAAAAGPVLLVLGGLAASVKALGLGILVRGLVSAGGALIPVVTGATSLSGALGGLLTAIGPAGWLIAGLAATAGGLAVWATRAAQARLEAARFEQQLEDVRGQFAGRSQETLVQDIEHLGGELDRANAKLASLRDQVEPFNTGTWRDLGIDLQTAQDRAAGLNDQIRTQEAIVALLDSRFQGAVETYREGALAANELGMALEGVEDVDLTGEDGGIGEDISDALDALQTSLRAARTQSSALGEDFNLAEAQAAAYESALQSLTEAGVEDLDQALGSSGITLREIATLLLEAAENADTYSEAQARTRKEIELINDVQSELARSLDNAAILGELLGDGFSQAEAEAAALRSAVDSLINQGVSFETIVGAQGETLRDLAVQAHDAAIGINTMQQAQSDAESVIAATQTPLERYEETVARLIVLNQTLNEQGQQLLDDATFQRAMEAAADAYDSATLGADDFTDAAAQVAVAGIDTFAAFAVGAGTSIRSFVQRALADLARLAARLAFLKILQAGTFGAGGFVTGLIGALGGARQFGGPVRAQTPYLVGEAGPELFVPELGGQIVSASQTSRLQQGSRLRTSPRGFSVAPVASNEGGGGGPRIDFSTFPPARNPLAAARDGDWQKFLRSSMAGAFEGGFDPGRT